MNDGSEGEENDLNMDIDEIEKTYSNLLNKIKIPELDREFLKL